MPARLRQEDEPITRMLLRSAARLVLFAFLWWVLTEGDTGALPAGALAVPIATAASLRLLPATGWCWSPAGLVSFVVRFLWLSLRGSLDVALRALDPRLPLAPRLLDYPLRLTSRYPPARWGLPGSHRAGRLRRPLDRRPGCPARTG